MRDETSARQDVGPLHGIRFSGKNGKNQLLFIFGRKPFQRGYDCVWGSPLVEFDWVVEASPLLDFLFFFLFFSRVGNGLGDHG